MMDEKEARQKKMDELKKGFGDGPWQSEPDRMEFESNGFTCLLLRSELGVWCGYVAIPEGHPWHGRHYDEVPAEAHGGLTFAEQCTGAICHVPKPGESENVWWIGFDCGHALDFVPSLFTGRFAASMLHWSYRDVAYARTETEKLAQQAAEAMMH